MSRRIVALWVAAYAVAALWGLLGCYLAPALYPMASRIYQVLYM